METRWCNETEQWVEGTDSFGGICVSNAVCRVTTKPLIWKRKVPCGGFAWSDGSDDTKHPLPFLRDRRIDLLPKPIHYRPLLDERISHADIFELARTDTISCLARQQPVLMHRLLFPAQEVCAQEIHVAQLAAWRKEFLDQANTETYLCALIAYYQDSSQGQKSQISMSPTKQWNAFALKWHLGDTAEVNPCISHSPFSQPSEAYGAGSCPAFWQS